MARMGGRVTDRGVIDPDQDWSIADDHRPVGRGWVACGGTEAVGIHKGQFMLGGPFHLAYRGRSLSRSCDVLRVTDLGAALLRLSTGRVFRHLGSVMCGCVGVPGSGASPSIGRSRRC